MNHTHSVKFSQGVEVSTGSLRGLGFLRALAPLGTEKQEEAGSLMFDENSRGVYR